MVAETSDRICADATDAIGHTPLVYLNKVTEGLNAKIAVKLEYMNPACSVKDRAGAELIEAAEKRGQIKPGDVLIEPTSGNMGIGLAYAAAVKGYKLILCMPSTMSLERKTLLKAYGAEVILTDPSKQVLGALDRAHELQKLIPNAHVLDQFSNADNTEIHYKTTGKEIWRQSQGKVDAVCFGIGSGGTMSGVGRYLKEQNPNVKVFAVEPFEASVINGFEHKPHTIPGMGAGFVPDLLDKIYEEALRVPSPEAVEMAKQLALREGLLAGISGGANVCAAIQLAKRPEFAGKLIVTSLASFGERYLSTLLYKDIKDEAEQLKETSLDQDKAYLSQKWGLKF